ncbi:hypothetical protein KQX54_017095 [Cotesia glomerata]|uniref:ANK_REP_REGION domain-containing protein n=1 Tax=Cotesia glomerata TaxID=32391 RepID=A0AAV7IAL4_COTGL|nr:hypothetical protein KQX54_017095 [Cotesia glomerata]
MCTHCRIPARSRRRKDETPDALRQWLCQKPNVNREAMNNDLITPYHIAFFARDDKMMDVLNQNGVQCRVPLQSETNSYDEGYEPECKSQKFQL